MEQSPASPQISVGIKNSTDKSGCQKIFNDGDNEMIDYDVKGEIPDNRLSFSKIRTVHTCPEKFRLQYVEKVRGMIGLPLILGSNWHVGLEHGIKRIIDSVVPKTKEVVEVAVESLKIDLKKTKSLDLDD